MKVSIGPQQNRANIVVLSEEDTRRLRRFLVRVGQVELARGRLGVGDATFEAARGFGRMQKSTRDRLLEALTREEALP